MADTLATLTQQRLRDAGIAFVVTDDSETLRIAAREPAVGDLLVSFADGEVSVFIGNITHCHFTPYAADDKFPGCTNEQAASHAVEFIREVMDDERIIWCGDDGHGGSYQRGADDDPEANTPLSGDAVKYFLWSGPLKP